MTDYNRVVNMPQGVGAVSVARIALPFDVPSPRERAELILGQLDQLPTLPAVAAKLLAVTASDESSARDVTRVIESDASLTAALLRMALRANTGIRAEGLNVGKAITLLGFRAVRNAVLSLKLHSTLSNSDDPPALVQLRRDLWKHGLAVACAADAIAAKTSRKGLSGDAFVCGLLHDIGKIALSACLPKSYARAAERAVRERTCICDIERELFGLDHATAGKRLALRWKLPPSVAESAWLHHHALDALPSTLAHADVVRVVHLADRLARRQKLGFSGYVDTEPMDDAAACLGLDAATLDSIAAELPQRMEPYFELVGLDDLTGPKLCAESLAKANEELARLNADLEAANAGLVGRSRCFELLRAFTEAQSHEHRPGDVCAVAARSVVEVLECPRSATFVIDHSRGIVHLGWCAENGKQVSSSVMDVAGAGVSESSELWRLIEADCGMIPAPSDGDLIWRRCHESSPMYQLFLLPIRSTAGDRGAVLFELPEHKSTWISGLSTECQALTHAMGLAVAYARVRDESERMNEELVEAHRRLRHAQTALVRNRSVAMIAEMAAGAAHEMGNPLAVISGRAQMLRKENPEGPLAAALDKIIEHTQRASSIATELMEFAKPSPPSPMEQRLGEFLAALARPSVERLGLKPEQLILQVADPEATVFSDAGQLQNTIESVLSNAAAAIDRDTGVIQINSLSDATDDTARIQIRDNGCGMTPHVLEHAIDPFFSSRTAGRGRGLGLSRANRFVEINGGRLRLESQEGAGTIVTIELPAKPRGAGERPGVNS